MACAPLMLVAMPFSSANQQTIAEEYPNSLATHKDKDKDKDNGNQEDWTAEHA